MNKDSVLSEQKGICFEVDGKSYTTIGAPGVPVADLYARIPANAENAREMTPEEIAERESGIA